MPVFMCVTCGTQFAESPEPPPACPVCEDERQYVGWEGQRWTTLEELRAGHRNVVVEEEPGLTSFRTEPKFAIGQRAFVVQAPGGNVLWDCLSLLDDESAGRVEALGGLAAIAISHPHYYSSMVEWSRAFGDAPILLHAADREWVQRPDAAIDFWEGETRGLGEGLTLVRCGGHFPGGAVLHWADGCEGRGALLSGDVIQVVQDRRWVSFMWSYPNLVPLAAEEVRAVAAAVEPYAYERIYGAFEGLTVTADAKAAVARSAERYVRRLDA